MPPFESSPQYEHGQPESLGVLLVNLGTPDAPTPAAVRRYLRQFLSDPRVVEFPRLLWWLVLHGFVLRTRPSASAKAYAKIWTESGSPLLLHSQSIAESVGAALANRLSGAVNVALGMSYGKPSIESAMQQLHDQCARRIVVLPLYPQYSNTTTGSVFAEATRCLATRRWIPELRFINHYHDAGGYISALAASVRQHWHQHGKGERLLMSFHGVPEKTLLDGDPYHGIYNSDAGTVNVINSTFSRNQAGQYSDGSALDNTDGGSMTLTNTIVANSLNGDNCVGPITDGGGNLTFPDDSCPGINLDPVLGSLANNGGPTLTVALMNGSSAVDNADDAVCAASPVNNLDQRGIARPVGNGCDIGAFESMAAPPAPDFVMQVDPAYAALCLGGSLDFDVELLSVMGFDEDVDLSVLNLPDGAEYSFDANPVAPPFTSTLTITDDSIAEPDWYTFDVVGSSITRTHSHSVSLYLYDVPAQTQANLLSPADGAVDVSWNPDFAWDPVPGATYYDLEVATDVNFTNIVYTATVLGLNETPYPTFQTGTEHFWRVKTSNYCGDGVVSEVHSFTTVGDTIPPTWYWDAERTWVYTCPELDATYDLTLYGITGFSEAVTLSTDRLPPGATSSFTLNPVTPSDKTILTISNLQADEAAEYAIEVIGTSDSQTKSYFLELNLKPGIPEEAPVGQTPSNGEVEVGGNPFFSWSEVTGAQWYILELAMDVDFNNIVYSVEVLQNSHVMPTPMMGDTEYYWRVTPVNVCGTGPTSTVNNFFTGESVPPPPPPPEPIDNVIYLPMVMGLTN